MTRVDSEFSLALETRGLGGVETARIRNRILDEQIPPEIRSEATDVLYSIRKSGSRVREYIVVLTELARGAEWQPIHAWDEPTLRTAFQVVIDAYAAQSISREYAQDKLTMAARLVELLNPKEASTGLPDTLRSARARANEKLMPRASKPRHKCGRKLYQALMEDIPKLRAPTHVVNTWKCMAAILHENGPRWDGTEKTKVKDVLRDSAGNPMMLRRPAGIATKRRVNCYLLESAPYVDAMLASHPGRNLNDFQDCPLFVDPVSATHDEPQSATDIQPLDDRSIKTFWTKMKKRLNTDFTIGPRSIRRQFHVDQAVKGTSLEGTRARAGHSKASLMHAVYAQDFDEDDLLALAARVGYAEEGRFCPRCSRQVAPRSRACPACHTILRAVPAESLDQADQYMRAQEWSIAMSKHLDNNQSPP